MLVNNGQHPLLTVTPSLMANFNQPSKMMSIETATTTTTTATTLNNDDGGGDNCRLPLDGLEVGSITPGGIIMLPTFRCSLESSPTHSQTNHSQMSRNSFKKSNNSNNYKIDGMCNEYKMAKIYRFSIKKNAPKRYYSLF